MRLFDTAYYLREIPKVAEAGAELRCGVRRRRSHSAFALRASVGTYNGSTSTLPLTPIVNRLQKMDAFTLAGVSTVS